MPIFLPIVQNHWAVIKSGLAGAQVDAEADLRSCVVMPGAKIGKGVRLNRSVIGPGATVAPETAAEESLFAFDPECGKTAMSRIIR